MLGDWYFPVSGNPIWVPSAAYPIGKEASKVWSGTDYPTTAKAKINKSVYSFPKPPPKPSWYQKYVEMAKLDAATARAAKKNLVMTRALRREMKNARRKAEKKHLQILKKLQREENSRVFQLRKQNYQQYWERRNTNKKRITQVEHPYSCTTTYHTWNDWAYESYNTFSKRLESLSIRSCKLNFGTGFSRKISSPLWSANDTIALQGKLRERIVGSSFDASVSLGEGRMALQMIGSTAIQLAAAITKLKRGDFIGAANALAPSVHKGSDSPLTGKSKSVREQLREEWLRKRDNRAYRKDISGKWLELQYGWMPLVQDVYAGAQALAKQLNEPLVRSYRARRRRFLQYTAVTGISGEAQGYTRGQLKAILTEVDIVALNGLMDPSSMAWELLPWSFIADWFLPIGQYLSARGMAQSLTGTFVTTISTKEIHKIYAYEQKTPGFLIKKGPASHYSVTTVNRTVSTSLATPKPTFKPLADVPSWTRAANAVALLTQAVTGKSVKFVDPTRATESPGKLFKWDHATRRGH